MATFRVMARWSGPIGLIRGGAASRAGRDRVPIGPGFLVRLLLVLLLVASPSLAVINPVDFPWIPGVSDGSDDGAADAGYRGGHAPLVTPSTPWLQARPWMASAQLRLGGSEIPPDPARRPPSSRSPPPR
jgi:hypothetical protein